MVSHIACCEKWIICISRLFTTHVCCVTSIHTRCHQPSIGQSPHALGFISEFPKVHECPPWYSSFRTRVAVNQFFCILHYVMYPASRDIFLIFGVFPTPCVAIMQWENTLYEMWQTGRSTCRQTFAKQLTRSSKGKTEVPRDVRNSKVRKQDKCRRDWFRH